MASPTTVNPPPQQTESEWESAHARRLRILCWLLVGLGIFWRLGRYLLQFPIWSDEAMLCLNFLDHDYVGLVKDLENCQIAPVLFLWIELTVVKLFGPVLLALRFLPLVAGFASMYLFWKLARQVLTPTAAVMAMAILSVSIWPVSMSTQAK